MLAVFVTNLKNCKGTFIIAITETWLSSDYCYNEILPKGYTIFQRDRNSRGGIVFLAVNDVIPSKLLDTPSDIEGVTVKINHTNPVVISVIYAAPQSSIVCQLFQQLSWSSPNLISTCLPIIVVGDFSLPDIDWTTLSGNSF